MELFFLLVLAFKLCTINTSAHKDSQTECEKAGAASIKQAKKVTRLFRQGMWRRKLDGLTCLKVRWSHSPDQMDERYLSDSLRNLKKCLLHDGYPVQPICVTISIHVKMWTTQFLNETMPQY